MMEMEISEELKEWVKVNLRGDEGMMGPEGLPGEPGSPGINYIKDDKYPEDQYTITVYDGKIVLTPYNKSAIRRSKLKGLLDEG